MNTKNAVTTVYFNEAYSDDDKIISEIYESDAERYVEQLIQSLEGFVVSPENIVRSKKEKLIKYYNKDYRKFYRLVEKIAKEAKQSL